VTDEKLAGAFRRWLWRPPRPHGEPIAGRAVSFLELFYDLVYVAVVSQAAHHLADHVSLRGVGGWLRPAPWLFALLLVAILSLLWFFAVSRFLGAGAWGDEPSHPR
jgi:low temperature requirement protein LtrA